jgi:succinylarginine dihydrolase
VGNGDLLFCHETAFRDQADALAAMRVRYAALGSGPLRILEVKSREVSLRAAVSTYLFNSQILGLPNGTTLLLAAGECREHPATRKYLEALPSKGLGIDAVDYADLRQSMRNGGGPACLRLRVAMTSREWAAVPDGVKMDEALFGRLKAWVERHYRDRLLPADLADPDLPAETRKALDGLDRILGLGH